MRFISGIIVVICLLTSAKTRASEGTSDCTKKKIGVCITATGKYIEFIPRLLETAREHFFPNDTVTYFIFSDTHKDLGEDVCLTYRKRLGWPYDSLKRSEFYYGIKHLLRELDYVFALDADMVFVDRVDDEILGHRVGTVHPWYCRAQPRMFPYEKRKGSSAYIGKHEGKIYYAGAFYGGTSRGFLDILRAVNRLIHEDAKKGIIARWHDESYLNKYFSEAPPEKLLTPEYCYAELSGLPFTPKIISLDKPKIYEKMKKEIK